MKVFLNLLLLIHLLSLICQCIGQSELNGPFQVLPPSMINGTRGWFVKGAMSKVLPFSGLLLVEPVYDSSGGSSEVFAYHTWQNFSFVGASSITFEGIAFQITNHSYAQAALYPDRPCYGFDEIINCSPWTFLGGADSPVAPLGWWSSNCSINRTCGATEQTTGYMNTTVYSAAGNPSEPVKLVSVFEMIVNSSATTSQLSWTFVNELSDPFIPPLVCPLCTSEQDKEDPIFIK